MQTKELADSFESTQHIAVLRLARGASSSTTWVLGNSKGPATVTIGSDASCDWQINAPDVAKHALSVALIDGELFISSGDEAAARLEGQPLPEAWQKVERTARVELGGAELELIWEAARDTSSQTSERDRVTLTEGLPDEPAAQLRTHGARASWVERFSRSPLMDTPTLLGRAVSTRSSSSQLLRYAGLALFTALAYRAWLVLLDRL